MGIESGFALISKHVDGLEWALVRSANPHRIHFLAITPEELEARAVVNRNLGSSNSGSGNDCYLKGINVRFDCYLDQSMHRQLLRYRFVDIVSSMSLEHSWREVLFDAHLMRNVDPLFTEALRAAYQVNKDREEPHDARWFLRNMPLGVLLGLSFRCNYLQLKTIYSQRKNHKHPGWREFCMEIAELPMFLELTQSKLSGRKEK